MADLIYIRIMEHNTEDGIRIGVSFPIEDTDRSIEAEIMSIREMYEQKTAWCGGFDTACEKYYRRIAIVNADTLEVICMIYERKETKK